MEVAPAAGAQPADTGLLALLHELVDQRGGTGLVDALGIISWRRQAESEADRAGTVPRQGLGELSQEADGGRIGEVEPAELGGSNGDIDPIQMRGERGWPHPASGEEVVGAQGEVDRVPTFSQRGTRHRDPGGEIRDATWPDDAGGVVTEIPGDHGRVVGEGRGHRPRPAVGQLEHQRVRPGVARAAGLDEAIAQHPDPGPAPPPADGASRQQHAVAVSLGEEDRDDPQAEGLRRAEQRVELPSRRRSTPRASGMKLSQASPTRTSRKPAAAIAPGRRPPRRRRTPARGRDRWRRAGSRGRRAGRSSKDEEVDPAGDVDHLPGDVARLGEARKTTVCATSSGSPAARIAVRSTMRSFMRGLPALNASVPMIPGRSRCW